MKRSVILLMFSVIALCSCHKELPGELSSTDTHYVTFKVNAADTKTSMSYDDGKFSMLWDEGDQIVVFEYADGYDMPVKYLSLPLSSSDITDNGKTAQFKVSIKDAEGSAFKYVALYPGTFSGGYEPYCEYLNWGGKEKSGFDYESWCYDWEYDGPQVEPHLLVRAVLPYEQYPTAGSFDPSANTMVSKVIESDSQISNMTELQFARIGGILRITLKGLSDYVGKHVTNARLSFGESFGGSLNCDYDTALERYKFYKDFHQIDLYPNGVTINSDGCADLYIRCYAGEITDWFSLYITLKGDVDGGKVEIEVKGGKEEDGKDEGVKEGPVTLGKYVDLKSLSRSVVIPEGGMGTFGVTSWGVVDVQGVDNISYEVNSSKDGFTATWYGVENAAGYNFSYASQTDQENKIKIDEVVDNGDGTYSATVTGLVPDTYVLTIIPIPVEGHALIDPNYYYPVYIPVGIQVTQSIYNYYFREDLTQNVSTYEADGILLNYYNIRQAGWGSTLVTSQSQWGLWNVNEFCNEIVGMTITADYDSATDNRWYLGETFCPMDYVKVEASSNGSVWTSVAPNYGEPDTYNNKYPVTYSFPEGTKFFKVTSNDEKLTNDVAADAGLMCTFYSIELSIFN